LNFIKGVDYINKYNIKYIDFLKIDVEGHEFNIIKGFEDMIRKVNIIQFKYSATYLDSGVKLVDIINYLKGYNFHNFSYLTNKGIKRIENFDDHYQYCNIVCFYNDENNNNNIDLISLGGVGGCTIAESISYIKRKYTRRYPYDWLLTNQSFVCESFLSFENFFDFDDASKIINNTQFLSEKKNALSFHDFKDYPNDKITVKEKYIRRFKRLQESMGNIKPLLFIRTTNNARDHPEWEDIFINEKDDFIKWIEFKKSLENTYNKKVYILIMTNNIDEYNQNCKFNNDKDGIFIRYILSVDKEYIISNINYIINIIKT
jgi:hypothetical protein